MGAAIISMKKVSKEGVGFADEDLSMNSVSWLFVTVPTWTGEAHNKIGIVLLLL